MNLEPIRVLLELAEKATDAPWGVNTTSWHNGTLLVHVEKGEGTLNLVASMMSRPRLGASAEQQCRNDAAFVSAARNSVPALSQLLEAVTWQPIETAPKDRAILCYNPMVGAYNSQWVKDPDEDAGLYRGTNFPCGHWGYCGTWFCVPTHWMPLPSPPEDK